MFIGLLRHDCAEISGKNYHRLNLSGFNFRISPPQLLQYSMTIINAELIAWPIAGNSWSPISCIGMFDEPNEGRLLNSTNVVSTRSGRPIEIHAGDRMVFCPGQMRFHVQFGAAIDAVPG
ncbi:MAG TPA: hypothetical protein VHA37_01845 [Candidatus Saccharimonadales bacterium]|nr:hypothetical protein [Candidatus Saccharimonadales bacterium]